jgi:hypothetical protein
MVSVKWSGVARNSVGREWYLSGRGCEADERQVRLW